MAAVTICSDCGAQKNKVWHCFHCFPIYFPWSDGTRCHDPYFFPFKSEFGNKEIMTWATVSSQFCFCWLYRASSSLAAKNIINLILVSTIWWCPCVESSLVLLPEGVCYDQGIFLAGFNQWIGKTPGEGHSNPLQYSCLENSMDREAWWATVHRVAESWTRLKCLNTWLLY